MSGETAAAVRRAAELLMAEATEKYPSTHAVREGQIPSGPYHYAQYIGELITIELTGKTRHLHSIKSVDEIPHPVRRDLYEALRLVAFEIDPWDMPTDKGRPKEARNGQG